MKTEYEVKILDIDPEVIRTKLEKLGAEYLGKHDQKRYVYDFSPANPNTWIRLRQKGEKVELTIKEILDDTIEGTKELEILVSDFDTAHEFLGHLGYFPRAYQENIRESYRLGSVEIDIDFWPQIPPYVEIEGLDSESVENIVKQLGFTLEETTSINTKKIYAEQGIDLDSIRELRF